MDYSVYQSDVLQNLLNSYWNNQQEDSSNSEEETEPVNNQTEEDTENDNTDNELQGKYDDLLGQNQDLQRQLDDYDFQKNNDLTFLNSMFDDKDGHPPDNFSDEANNYRNGNKNITTNADIAWLKTKDKTVNLNNLDKTIEGYLNTLPNDYKNSLVATSGNDADVHVPNSKHYKNEAVDLRYNQDIYDYMVNDPNLKALGLKVLPPNHGTAPHIHIEKKQYGGKIMQDGGDNKGKKTLQDYFQREKPVTDHPLATPVILPAKPTPQQQLQTTAENAQRNTPYLTLSQLNQPDKVKQYIDELHRQRDYDKMGLNNDGSKKPITALQDNPHFQKGAENLILPTLQLTGALATLPIGAEEAAAKPFTAKYFPMSINSDEATADGWSNVLDKANSVKNDLLDRLSTTEGQRRLLFNKRLGADELVRNTQFQPLNDDLAYYDYENKFVGINPNIPSDYTKAVARHELQHRIQIPDNFSGNEGDAYTPIDKMLKDLDIIKYNRSEGSKHLYNIGEQFKSTPPTNAQDITKMLNNNDANSYYFDDNTIEKSAFLSELQQHMVDNNYISHPYDKITPDIVKNVYDNMTPDNLDLRILRIAEPTKSNFKIISKALNNLPAVAGATAVGAAAINKKKYGGKYKTK